MYSNILLATDLESESRYVQDKAASIQKLTGAKMSIIHIIEPTISALSLDEYSYGAGYQETVESLTKAAKELLAPIIKRMDIDESNMVIGTGKASREVLFYAKQKEVDLIITGSHGRHGIERLLGSTANSIIHGSKCDVLAIRMLEPEFS
jgi:universal stress protein A